MYLIDYPYGCTEQTMSRFLPAAITAKTLKDLGLQPEDIMGRIFGGIETNSAAATHPKGKHDLAELDKMHCNKASTRLYNFQHADGGWGWWKEGDSDHFAEAAYVVWGLTLARDADIGIKSAALTRGVGYLDKTLVEEELNLDQQAWMLHALATFHASEKKRTIPARFKPRPSTISGPIVEKLNAYTPRVAGLERASFRLRRQGEDSSRGTSPTASSSTTSRILPCSSRARLPAPVIGTAHWGEDGIYWRWSVAAASKPRLLSCARCSPSIRKNKLVEPVSNLAHQKSSRRAMEQHPRHRHHRPRDERLPARQR